MEERLVGRKLFGGMVQKKIRGAMEIVSDPYQDAVIGLSGPLDVITQGGRRQVKGLRQLFLCQIMQVQ